MKAVHLAIPIALTAVFALIYPRLQNRDWLEVQRRQLVTRAESYDPKTEESNVASQVSLRGAIQDERAALAAAETVWIEIYGAKSLAIQKPFQAYEAKGRWHVQGTLPRNMLGGVAHVILAKDDGRVIKVWHDQ